MTRLMEQKIDATNPKAEYCSMTAMILGIMDVRKLTLGGADAKLQPIYDDYFLKMQLTRKKAEEIERTEGFAAAIDYRAKMATKWSQIVRAQINTKDSSIEEIYATSHLHDLAGDKTVGKVKKHTQSRSGTILMKQLDDFDTMARQKDVGSQGMQNNNRTKQPESEEPALSA